VARWGRSLLLLLLTLPPIAVAVACNAFDSEPPAEVEPERDASTTTDAPPSLPEAGGDAGAPKTIAKVVAGTGHACAIFQDGRLKCWGANASGALGIGTTEPHGRSPGTMGDALPYVDLGTGRRAVDVVAGGNPARNDAGEANLLYTCVLLDDATVKCWGYNGYGNLGRGNTLDIGKGPNQMGDNLAPVSVGAKVKAIAGGLYHVCALLEDRQVKCWGFNSLGNLGIGDVEHRGNKPGDMGLSLRSVQLGRPATAIAAGGHQACALLDDGRVTCWGYNLYGGLGLGDTASRGGSPDAGVLASANLGERATAIACGWHYACALLTSGALKCWGYNGYGNLGVGDTTHRGASADAGLMGDALPVVDLGKGAPVKSLSLGDFSTCALRNDGTAKCFGNNTDGQLGINDSLNRGGAPGSMGDNLPVVGLRGITQLSMGYRSACAIAEGTLRCWGNNDFGQLGLGDTASRGDKPGDMGGLPAVDLGR
jgi:alpha-tubulin suppressor-like RCC1 family protein